MDEIDKVENTIFMTITGSHAYGINVAGSDVDIKGICIPRERAHYLGLPGPRFEQYINNKEQEDLTIYDLRKAIHLMALNNPNMLELLFMPDKFWLIVRSPWLKFQEVKETFLSKQVKHTYGGYAFAQLKKIRHHRGFLLSPPKGKPERKNFGLEKRLVSNDELQQFLWFLSHLMKDTVEMIDLSDKTKEELAALNFIGLVQGKLNDEHSHAVKKLTGMPDGFIDSCMREKAYLHAVRDFEAYEKWKRERNPKRKVMEEKVGYCVKHAVHLVRLMRMGIEILDSSQVNVYRNDQDELLAIRNGEWTFDEIEGYSQELNLKLNESYESSLLPDKPSFETIENLTMDVIQDYVGVSNEPEPQEDAHRVSHH